MENRTYVVYGLRVSSPVWLPGLRRANGPPDVVIEYDQINSEENCGSSAKEIHLSYDGVGAIDIRDGRRIVLDTVRDIDDAELRPYILGPALAAILHQRGYLVLHASCVSIRDTGVGFLGASGAGKSTIAAACRMRGHDILSDDITAVDISDGHPSVVPGPPVVKLSQEVVGTLDTGGDVLWADPWNEEFYHVSGGVPESNRPLERLYLFTDGDLRTQRMEPSEIVQALVGNTYTHSVLDDRTIDTHFEQCIDVATGAELNWLSRPMNLDSLSDTVKLIEREVG